MATKDFITYDPSSGTTNKTISVTVPQSEGEDRTTSLNITGSGVTKTINISQEGKGIYFRSVTSKFSQNGNISLNGNVIGNFSGQVFIYNKFINKNSTLSFIVSTSRTNFIGLDIFFGPNNPSTPDPLMKQVKSIVLNNPTSGFDCYVVASTYKYNVRLTYGASINDGFQTNYTVTFEDNSTVNIVVTYKDKI